MERPEIRPGLHSVLTAYAREGKSMSRNDDEKKAKEMQKAVRPPGREAHLNAPLMELQKAMRIAIENRNREQFEEALRKHGCPGPKREEFLKQYDEILRRLLAGWP